MIIVDSSVWIDLLTGADNVHTDWLEGAILGKRIGVPDLVLCEVLRGIRKDSIFHKTRNEFLRYEILHCGGEAVAVAAAQNFRFLQSKGITVRKTIDCLLATFCILEGHELVHRDRDFNPFEYLLGLRVIHPARH